MGGGAFHGVRRRPASLAAILAVLLALAMIVAAGIVYSSSTLPRQIEERETQVAALQADIATLASTTSTDDTTVDTGTLLVQARDAGDRIAALQNAYHADNADPVAIAGELGSLVDGEGDAAAPWNSGGYDWQLMAATANGSTVQLTWTALDGEGCLAGVVTGVWAQSTGLVTDVARMETSLSAGVAETDKTAVNGNADSTQGADSSGTADDNADGEDDLAGTGDDAGASSSLDDLLDGLRQYNEQTGGQYEWTGE